jgi:phage shock protein A
MKRLGVILAAIWSKFLGKAEDKHHREILDLGYEKLSDMLIKVKQDLANVATSKHRIMRLVSDSDAEAAKLETSATQFLAAGDEARAREALTRKAIAVQQGDHMRAQLTEVEAQQLELEANQRELETRIESFKSEKELIKAKFSAAEARARIGETVTGINEEALAVTKSVERLRGRTEELEARGDGIQELIQSGALTDVFNPGQTELDRAALELQRTNSVDADLERLKKQLPATTGATK